MRPRVFVTQPIAQNAVERLRAVADVEVYADGSRVIPRDALLDGVRRADVLYCLLHDRIDRDVVAANPKLRGIASMAITPAGIDVAEATARKLPVTVIPPIVGEATADIAFGLILAVARRMVEGDRLVRQGIYPGGQSNYIAGACVYGKVLGLVGGGGRIGKAVARRARGFDMKVLYWGPRRRPEAEEHEAGITYIEFDRLLAESDFVSLHSPLTPETRHQIGAREIALMKRTAFIVNTSRGPIIDEPELIRALREQRIAGAGLDVFENEPLVPPELRGMTNVVLTPHLGSAVVELREVMANIVADNAIAILEGRKPPNLYNPEIFGA